LVLAGAVFINLMLFGMAPYLLQDAIEEVDLVPYEVSPFLSLPLPEPKPAEEQAPTPPSEKPRLELRSMPSVASPALDVTPPQLDLDFRPQMLSGLEIPVPGPSRFEISEVDQAPVIISRIPPRYPFLAKRRAIEGWVRIRFLVTRQGEVSSLRVLQATPEGVFDDAVRNCLALWRFRPGRKNKEAVSTWMETTIEFELEKQ
jgi:protein TonB